MSRTDSNPAPQHSPPGLSSPQSPFLHAAENARTVFLVTTAAACGPLLAGIFLFGWRAAVLAATCVLSCAIIERAYYAVTRIPALLGREHAYLTGLLLALTLPPFAPWYVAVIASAFAIILGKAIFGGVGHFLWQPALVGRLAVAVIFPAMLSPALWPVLAQDKMVVGDVQNCRWVEGFDQWRGRPAPKGADGFKLPTPRAVMSGLTTSEEPAFSAFIFEDQPLARSVLIKRLPAINDLLCGAWPGGTGETCIIVIVMAGLYLVYRHYVKWRLPLAFLIAAGCVVAIAPVRFAGPNSTVQTVWLPLTYQGLDVGFVYVIYQLLGGELLLAAFFLAPEMTSRPVTGGGQAIFGLGCGVLAMILRLYTDMPTPCYMAILAMNTLTPLIDALWRPRVLGTPRLLPRLWRKLRFRKTAA